MRRPRLHFDIGAEDKSGRAFSSLQKSLDDSQKSVVAMRSQFLAAAAVSTAFFTGVGAAAMRGAGQIDEAAKASRRLESSIGGYRAAQLAAGELGVSLSGLTNDLQTMNRELASNSAGAQRALERLGMSASDLRGLDADQQLAALADQVQQLGLGADEASVLLRDLGIRNREMVLAVMGGGDVFRRARDDVADYGLALDSVDASRIEEANDRIGRLGLISQYAGQQLAIALVPRFGELAQAMTDSLREGGLLRALIDGLADNVDLLGKALVVLTAAAGTRYVGALIAATAQTNLFTLAAIRARGAVIALGGPLGILYGILGGAAAAMILFRDTTDTATPIMDSARDAVDRINAVLAVSSEAALPAAQRATLNLTNENIKLAKSAYAVAEAELAKAQAAAQYAQTELGLQQAFSPTGAHTQAEADFAARMSELSAASAALRAAQDELTSRIEDGQLALSDAEGGMADYQDRVMRLGVEIDGLDNALNRVGGGGGSAAAAGQSLDELTDAMERAEQQSGQLESAFESAFVGFVTGANSAKEAAGQLLQQLSRLLAQSAFRSLMGGMGGGGFLSGLFGGFRANGGPVSAGKSYIVGERGPELFTPGASGQITSNEALRGGEPVQVVVRILPSGEFDSRVSDTAGRVAVSVVQAYDRQALPGSVQRVSNDPRRRG